MKQEYKHISGNIEMLDKVNFKYVSPRASIFLSSLDKQIVAEEKRWNRVEFFDDKTGALLFWSSPPSRKKYGIFAWLKFIPFCAEDQIIAEIRYRSWLGRPYFIANNENISVEIHKNPKQLIYCSDKFEIIVTHSPSSTNIRIFNESYLYPCIGFAHYIWASKWS